MRKFLIAALVAAVLAPLGVLGFATAEPGPNGENDHGLCTAYFNGQKNGHDGRQPGPFAGLEETGRNYTDNDGVDNDQDGQTDEDGENESLSAAENIFNYCENESTIGGNPDHGRYSCVLEGENSDPECTDNPAPGKSGK